LAPLRPQGFGWGNKGRGGRGYEGIKAKLDGEAAASLLPVIIDNAAGAKFFAPGVSRRVRKPDGSGTLP
jgi:hypothetical protein